MSPGIRKLAIIAGVVSFVFAAWWYMQMPSPKMRSLDRPKLTLSSGDDVQTPAARSTGRTNAVRNSSTKKPPDRKRKINRKRKTPKERREAARKRREARLKRRSAARDLPLDATATRKAPKPVGYKGNDDPGKLPLDEADEILEELEALEQLDEQNLSDDQLPPDDGGIVIE